MIYLGCTQENTFQLPFAESEIAAIYITYCQKGEIVIEKEKQDCVFKSILVPPLPTLEEVSSCNMKEVNVVTVTLSQEDSLKFGERSEVQIQIRVRLTNGTATKSKIIHEFTDTVLKEGVV